MVLPTVLRKNHSLKVCNGVVTVIRRVRAAKESPSTHARLQSNRPLEEMSMDDLGLAFRDLTGGESVEEILGMAGRENNIVNARLLLHHAVVVSNEIGQPTGQDLMEPAGNCTLTRETRRPQTSGDTVPVPKRPRVDTDTNTFSQDDLLDRIKVLEESVVTGTGEHAIQQLKDKVRALCLQPNPSDQLIMLSVDELARASRRAGHTDADTYEELARQVVRQQGRISIASLCLSVIGGKASETIVKALNKCLKERQFEEKATKQVENERQQVQSPLTNLYPPVPYMYPPGPQYPVPTPSYIPPAGQPHNLRFMYPRGPRQPRVRGACLFCEATDHYIRDCKKMEHAKKNQSL